MTWASLCMACNWISSESATLKQLRIEIEKTRRLREVYRQRKELDVEIEGAPTGAGN